jgi:hypothetical protein
MYIDKKSPAIPYWPYCQRYGQLKQIQHTMRDKLLGLILILITLPGFGQKSDKLPRYFADPIVTDSSSTMMIPTRYNAELLSSSKIALWDDYYANIIFYDFKMDSSKKLFPTDTFIKGFNNNNSLNYRLSQGNKNEQLSSKWIFYFVKSTDLNDNGRIDDNDPSVLYVSDKYGNDLKPLTPTNENFISIDLFEKQGFALIKMQRDQNNDKNFRSGDKDFYYIKLDLNKLTLGNKIEIR